MARALSGRQLDALRVLRDAGSESVWISNETTENSIASGTATALEERGLIRSVDVGRVSEAWIVLLNEAGLLELAIEEEKRGGGR